MPPCFKVLIYFIGITMLTMSACTARPHAQTTPSANWQQLPQRVINGTAFRHYASVGRSDGSTRRMLIDEAALQHWQPGQPLPHGALIVMQTWLTDTESTSFSKRVEADGTFSYGSFTPAQPNFETHTDNDCASCHEVSADKPGTFTQLMLNAAVSEGQLMTTNCNRAGRVPCEDEVYSHFVPTR